MSLATDRSLPEAVSPLAETYQPDPSGHRMVFDPDLGRTVEAAIYERRSLEPGAVIAQPAVIVEDETSTFVAYGFTATINRLGQIVLSKETTQS